MSANYVTVQRAAALQYGKSEGQFRLTHSRDLENKTTVGCGPNYESCAEDEPLGNLYTWGIYIGRGRTFWRAPKMQPLPPKGVRAPKLNSSAAVGYCELAVENTVGGCGG